MFGSRSAHSSAILPIFPAHSEPSVPNSAQRDLRTTQALPSFSTPSKHPRASSLPTPIPSATYFTTRCVPRGWAPPPPVCSPTLALPSSHAPSSARTCQPTSLVCAFLHFFALAKMLSPLFSINSTLFAKNIQGGVPLPRRLTSSAPSSTRYPPLTSRYSLFPMTTTFHSILGFRLNLCPPMSIFSSRRIPRRPH
jgi:hypothetical protein